MVIVSVSHDDGSLPDITLSIPCGQHWGTHAKRFNTTIYSVKYQHGPNR